MDFQKPRYTPMSRRRRIYEGKAKVLYEGPEPGTLIQHFKDDATAFNAKKHEVIEGKGVLNNRISEYVFQHLNDIGVPTHFIRRLNMREQLIREVEIIPLEVVVRNVAAGSLATRLGIDEGTQLPRSIIEFYYKNDALNDPMVSEEHITAFGWASPQEIDDIMALAIRVNDFLSGVFLGVGIRLVDFKMETGRLWENDVMRIVVADEISPDSCRLWDIKTNNKLDKDRFRRDLGIGLQQPAEIAAEAVLVELVVGLDVPQPAAIGRNLVGHDDAHHVVFPQPAGFHLEVDQADADAEEHAREEVVDTDGERHDVVDFLRASPAEGGDVLFRHHRVVERVILVIKLDDRARQLGTLVDAEPGRQRAGGDIAHHHLERDDLHLADQLLAHVEPADEMRGNPDIVEVLEYVFGDPVVENAFAFNDLVFLGVEGGGVILEVLNQRSRLGALIEDLRLALINAAAATHRGVPVSYTHLRAHETVLDLVCRL